MPNMLEEEIALIAGCSSGIGRAASLNVTNEAHGSLE